MLIYAVTALVIAATLAFLLFHELTAHEGSLINSGLVIISMTLLAFSAWHFIRRRMVTCENQVESALAKARQSDEAFNIVLDKLPAAVVAIGRQFNILRINERVSAIHTLSAADAFGKKCYDLFGSGEVCDNCPVAKALSTKEVHQNVKREISRAGQEIYIEQTAIPILRDNGEVTYVLEVVIDATERVRLEHANRDMFMQTVGALVNLIDKRDTATGIHSTAVSEIATGISQELGLAAADLEEISVAALLHDIGKIGIPESILNKPARLTPEEYAVVRTHSEIGYNALRGIRPLARVAEHLLYHHERYDGQGYPTKKQGQDIPLISRILCVADIFEAITAQRVYRPAMNIAEALDVMAAGRGTIFDPLVLDAFYAYLKKGDPDAARIIDKQAEGAA